MNTELPRIGTPDAGVSGAIESAVAGFAAAVVRADRIDPLITELVRLRCARVHDCRLCSSLRQRSALDEGLDERMVDQVDRHETSALPAPARAALKLCDAMILTPGRVDPALRAELNQHFDAGQIAEIMLDIVKWSQQKALVALRTEAPPWSSIEMLDFDDHGEPLFCGPV